MIFWAVSKGPATLLPCMRGYILMVGAVLVSALACSTAAPTATAPIPYVQQTMEAKVRRTKEAGSSATPTPISERVQIGFWNHSPSPLWLDGTVITIYRDGVDGKLILESRYFDGSSRVQELIQSPTQAARYDVAGDSYGEYFVLQNGVLGAYDPDGLDWEATKK